MGKYLEGTDRDWIVLTVRFADADDEAIASFVAECVDLGAAGGSETSASQPLRGPHHGHSRTTARKEVQVEVYFPYPGDLELQALVGLVEARARAVTRTGRARFSLVRSERVKHQPWTTAWKGSFPPTRVTDHFWVLPPWSRFRLPEDARGIILRPGPAFGTGRHVTTRHCLSFLEELHRERGGLPRSFLDVGCGSGILTIAAWLLGATRVLGLDIDRDALDSARGNLHLNNISSGVLLVQGSLECCGERFELIAANLDATTLLGLRTRIRDALAPGGSLVLSGILDEEKLGVKETFNALNLACQAEKTDPEEGWVSLLLRESGQV